MVVVLTSCGSNVKTKETSFKNVAIPEQTIEFKAKELQEQGELKQSFLTADIIVKGNEDSWLYDNYLEAHLLDKNGVELITLGCERVEMQKGSAKLVEFESKNSSTKDKKELEQLVSRVKSVKFSMEE